MASKIFKIIADYRPHNPDKPNYFIAADTPQEAREHFCKIVPYMKVYGCREIKDPAMIQELMNNRYKYIVFGRYAYEPEG